MSDTTTTCVTRVFACDRCQCVAKTMSERPPPRVEGWTQVVAPPRVEGWTQVIQYSHLIDTLLNADLCPACSVELEAWWEG